MRNKYYSGEISYLQWAQHDIGMWIGKGVKKNDFFNAIKSNKVKLMKNTLQTINELKKAGLKLAIISGSLDIILEYLMPNYKELFDDIFISSLHFDNKGNITNVGAKEFDMDGKVLALKKIAEREKIKFSECVFVGDHHNDIKIAQEAGLSIAFDAKDEKLRKVSDVIIDKKDLREILKHVD